MHISISKGPLKYGVYDSSKITGPQTTLYSLRGSGPGFRGVITKKKIGARYPSGNKTVGREHTVTTWTPGTFFFSWQLYIFIDIYVWIKQEMRVVSI